MYTMLTEMDKKAEDYLLSTITLRVDRESKELWEKTQAELGVRFVNGYLRKAFHWQLLRLSSMARWKKEERIESDIDLMEMETRMRFMEAVSDYNMLFAKHGEWDGFKKAKKWMKENLGEICEDSEKYWRRTLVKKEEAQK
jgi:uncharacterized protein (DUF2164 family)